jgi:ribosomal protein S18 acetylase RimI-like enzyme
LAGYKVDLSAIGISGIQKTLRREAMIQKKQPQVSMYYLWFIGVNPLYQYSGIGSKLLKELIADARSKDRLVFLETSTIKNLPWYERFGFQVYDRLELSYSLFFLKNIPA